MSDHDPWNEPETAHPRARELMTDGSLWDCVDEEAPFGSDEGHDAYYEFRDWRRENPAANLTECLGWIMTGQLEGYSRELCSDARVDADLEDPNEAFLADSYDTFTLDTTVIATALGQLLDEGRIDAEAKPYVEVAITRQLHPRILSSAHRKRILLLIRQAVDVA